MKRFLIPLIFLSLCMSCINPNPLEEPETFPVLVDKYLVDEKPDLQAVLFAPDIISTGKYELNAVFSPDFSEFYFSIRLLSGQIIIMCMNKKDGNWTEPEVASFSGKYSDADPFITNDNNWLYFISKRPIDPSHSTKNDYDIWRVKRSDDGWGKPERLDTTINSEFPELYPSLTRSGNLYFSSGRDNASGGRDIFRSEWNGNEFLPAKRLEGAINDYREGDIFISPDEDYLIYNSNGRNEGSGLFISFWKDGMWESPKFMGQNINFTGGEYCPMVTPDGAYLFYTSEKSEIISSSDITHTVVDIRNHYETFFNNPQNGLGDIYWVDAKIIEDFRDNN